MTKQRQDLTAKYKPWVWILSIAIPVVVAILFLIRIPNVAPLNFLPPIYAVINATTALVLITAYVAIRRAWQSHTICALPTVVQPLP